MVEANLKLEQKKLLGALETLVSIEVFDARIIATHSNPECELAVFLRRSRDDVRVYVYSATYFAVISNYRAVIRVSLRECKDTIVRALTVTE